MKPASNLIRIGSGKTDRKSAVDAWVWGRRGVFSIRDQSTNDGREEKVPSDASNISSSPGTEIPAKS
jgi:hypothetical protein